MCLVLVSLGDTLHNDTEHIVSKDPDELVKLFIAAQRRRADAIRANVWALYCPYAPQYLPVGKHGRRSQAELIAAWCNQGPILEFNSCSYDLNLIKKNFIDHITERGAVRVAKKEIKTMFLSSKEFNF